MAQISDPISEAECLSPHRECMNPDGQDIPE